LSIFDSLAKEWDLNPNRLKSAKALSETIQKLIPLSGKKIIDYGAGTGLVTFSLCDDAKEVLAMDNSKGMLEELDKKVSDANITNIKTFLHDIEDESLPTGYDLFISAMTMHHIEDTKMFLTKAKESLNVGGYLAITDLVSEDGSFHSRGNDGVYHFGFDRSKIVELYKELGFEIVYDDIVEVIKKDQDFPIFLIVGRYV
jgi:2-polyprenyl-3-methyl-5-hydroxy-6-metoxy-1,4-benzoquinol methylase